ncbi:MAG: hypothetical protein GY820_46635 [Gammaproteobacteria bacterium]|nr:hypothetical protein [Gammaproteobacteria bacterium]
MKEKVVYQNFIFQLQSQLIKRKQNDHNILCVNDTIQEEVKSAKMRRLTNWNKSAVAPTTTAARS